MKAEVERSHRTTQIVSRLLAILLCISSALTFAQTAPAGRKAVRGRLRSGRIVTEKITAGQSHVFEVSLEAGQFMHVILHQPVMATALRLISPDAKDVLIERKLAGGLGRDEPLYWIASTAGRFRIELSTDEPGKPARFGIELHALRKAQPEDEPRIAAQDRFERARILSEQLESDQSLALWQQAVALFQQAGDRGREGAALLNLGLEYQKQRKFDAEIGAREKALAIFHAIPDAANEGETLRTLGAASLSLNQIDRVVPFFDQAIAIFRRIKDRQGEVRVLNSLGAFYSGRRQPDKAIAFYDQGLILARSLDDRFDEGRLLHNIGSVKIGIGRDQEAIGDYEASLAIARSRNDRMMVASCLNGLGYAFNNLDRYDEAIRNYQQALTILREIKDRPREASALNNLGLAYSNINEFEKSLPHYDRALEIYRDVHDRRGERQVAHNLAWSYTNLKQEQKAREYYDLALAISRELKDPLSEGRLLMDIANGSAELEQALAILRAAKDRQGESWTLRILGGAYRKQGQFEKAAQSTAQAIVLAHEIKEPSSEAASLAEMMEVYKDLGVPRLATFYGKRAVNLLQAIRLGNRGLSRELQAGMVKGNERTYHTLADLLLAQGRLGEAEQVLALLKDEEYFNFLRRDSDNSDVRTRKAGLTREEEDYDKRFDEIQDRLVGIGVERSSLIAKPSLNTTESQRLSKLEQDIAAGNAVFTKFLDTLKLQFDSGPVVARVEQLAEAQGIMEDLSDLPAGTVAIYTLVADDKFREILVTPDVQKSYEYPIQAADLNAKVLEFRRLLQNPNLDPRPLANELYSILIGKMAGDLEQAKAKTLMWSLDGTLRYLPVSALFDGRQYLIEKFAVSMFTPVSNARLKERPDHDWRAAGFGVTKAYEGEPALPSVASDSPGLSLERPAREEC